jgi:hypothetical protein
MTTVVNEPRSEYSVSSWHITPIKEFPTDESIIGMDDKSVFVRPPSFQVQMIFLEKPKRSLSKLRGRMTKQNEKEIDAQILDLRIEWDRSI